MITKVTAREKIVLGIISLQYINKSRDNVG